MLNHLHYTFNISQTDWSAISVRFDKKSGKKLTIQPKTVIAVDDNYIIFNMDLSFSHKFKYLNFPELIFALILYSVNKCFLDNGLTSLNF